MKKMIIFFSLLFVAFGSQCGWMDSFSSYLQKGASSMAASGKDMLSKQANAFAKSAKDQATALLEKAKTETLAQVEKTKTTLTKTVSDFASATKKTLMDEATKIATENKNKIVEQAKAIINKTPLGQSILANMSAADKAKAENMTETEKTTLLTEANKLATDAASAVLNDSIQVEQAATQAINTTLQNSTAVINANIASKKSSMQSSIKDKFKL